MKMTIKIMVVDDDQSVRQLLGVALPLSRDDVEIVGEAVDGDEAVAKARELRPDLIILDHMMPRRTGASAVPDIRKACPATEIVFFSAYIDAVDAGQAMSKMHDEYGIKAIPKGDITELEVYLDRVAGHKRLASRPPRMRRRAAPHPQRAGSAR